MCAVMHTHTHTHTHKHSLVLRVTARVDDPVHIKVQVIELDFVGVWLRSVHWYLHLLNDGGLQREQWHEIQHRAVSMMAGSYRHRPVAADIIISRIQTGTPIWRLLCVC